MTDKSTKNYHPNWLIRRDIKKISYNNNYLVDQLEKEFLDKDLNQIEIIESSHYNRWLTDNIQNYLKSIEGEIRCLFEPFIEFKKMGTLFGLYKNFIPTNRMCKNSQKIIAVSTLDKMRENFKKNIAIYKKKYPNLLESLLIIQSDIIKFIDEYEVILKPKPTPDYQMFNHHPSFKRGYFETIDTYEKAYWLGFLFADGWIAIEHKKSGSYYRMGMELSSKDNNLIKRFCKCIGLNPKYIKDRLRGRDFSTKLYQTVEIRWGDQKFAQDLLNLGMRYEQNEEKGRRVKTPKLPILQNRKLMLAFLLGFYDGDGTLGFDKKTGKIRPRIASSEIEFLHQIKQYFGIKYQISTTEMVKFNIRTEKMVNIIGSRLDIDKEIFKEMLNAFKNSLEIKRVPIDFFNTK
ncbi:MAG: LAGLIDADG family homing endonuclease [Promethearchaeota archaeon]